MGVDHVPQAISRSGADGARGTRFLVADVTDLTSAGLGSFDFFVDVRCFQRLSARQRLAESRGVTALAGARATLPILSFDPTRIRPVVGGVSRVDVENAYDGWEVAAADAAETVGSVGR